MTEVTLRMARGRIGQVRTIRGRLAQLGEFARSVEPRPRPSHRAIVVDVCLASAVMVASLAVMPPGPPSLTAAVLTSGPLAARRRFPLAAFLVVLVGALATRDYATHDTFVAIVIAAYSATVYSRYRGAALLIVGPAGMAVAFAFWNATDVFGVRHVVPLFLYWHRPGDAMQMVPGGISGSALLSGFPWRAPATLVLVSLASISMVGVMIHVGDRLRRMQAEHEAATRRTLELERARIASELHDVVTHNVSVMVVQAGAARQVLTGAPDEARAALMAVEASGRAAMTELRHLLGLLSPPPDAGEAPGDAAGESPDLRPAPGLGQLQALIDRVSAAGLPVELQVGDVPEGLPPGLDLAAYRVIQEALTNVLKHAGKASTIVRLGVRDGSLTVQIADAGAPFPAVAPVPGAGRGLVGLRERVALYGGELEAGPRPGGGWLVRARLPVDPLSAGLAPAGAGTR